MKKLVLSALLSGIAINACGMQPAITTPPPYDLGVELAKQDVAMAKAIVYPILGTVAVGVAGYFGSRMWTDYLLFAHKAQKAANASNATGISQKSSWAPYAKIAAGLGLTGLTAYLGMKQPAQANSIMNHYSVADASGGVGSTLSPQVMISFGSLYTLAPMMPAYYFLKSGFDDLKKNS